MNCSVQLRGRFLVGMMLALASNPTTVSAAIIGTNTPAQPLTAERIDALPSKIRGEWKDYLKHSQKQRQADQAFLQKEMRHHSVTNLLIPAEARGRRWLPLDRPAAWYGDAERRRIAATVISFQTPAGGWSKNLDMSGAPRAPGMHFAADNSSRFQEKGDFDAPIAVNWNYVGTFDNDATIMQLRFLARVIAAVGPKQNAPYCAAFTRGLDYIFTAQYPNGGWPQVYPLQGGYHDAITYNDNALINILTLLRDVSLATNEFSFVSRHDRRRANAALQRGIEDVLAAQVIEDGRRLVWAQQYDPLTLQPTSARNYEMPSLAAGESSGVMLFLMQLPHPDARVVAAVRAAADWFEKTEVRNVAFRTSASDGRLLVPADGAGPLWARYYALDTDRPLFGDRDRSIHDNVNEISKERRNGYAWYSEAGKRALEQFDQWSKANP